MQNSFSKSRKRAIKIYLGKSSIPKQKQVRSLHKTLPIFKYNLKAVLNGIYYSNGYLKSFNCKKLYKLILIILIPNFLQYQFYPQLRVYKTNQY